MAEIKLVLPRLHNAQQEILKNSRRFNVCCLGRRTGKTVLGVDVIVDGPHAKGALHGHPTAWYTPTYSAMKEVWRHISRVLKPVIVRKSEQERRLDILGGGSIEFWSLDNPDAGRGRKYATVVIDEAAMVRNLEDAFENNIRPLLADYRGEAWILSTPKGNNYFKTLFDRGRESNPSRDPEWVSFQMPTWVNPHIAPEEIEAMRRSMPRLSFLQEVEAQFVSFAGTFIKAEYLHKGQPPEGMTLYMGVDLAISMKENADYTAIVVLGVDESGRIWIVDAHRDRVGFRDAIELIKRKASRWHPEQIAVEAVQYQAAVVEELLRSTDLPVVRVRPDKDKLTRAQGLIARYEQGIVWHDERLPAYFDEEVLAFGPDAEHDDLVDAAVYAFWLTGEWGRAQIILEHEEQQRQPAPEVTVVRAALPDHGQFDRCSTCASFKDGRCEDRGLRVNPNDPACSMYLSA